MTKCPTCGKRIDSAYIREGERALWKKIGYFCTMCVVHYDMKLKPYVKAKKSLVHTNALKTRDLLITVSG
jgi:hypothetical protein